MSKVKFSFWIILLCIGSLSAQFEMGVKFGINSTDLNSDTISIITNNSEELSLAFKEADYGVHIGLYTRLSALGWYLEPAAFLNSSNVTYQLSEFNDGEIITSLKNESFFQY